MNKKQIISACLMIIVIVVIVFMVKNKKINKEEIQQNSLIKIKNDYDEETDLYYIQDELTGEIIYASQDENDSRLKFYTKHPDYNPNPLQPRSSNLKDFITGYGVSEENFNIE